MAEYIDRKALGIGKCNPDIFEDKGYANGWNSAIKIIEEAPTVDAEPVKHGEWLNDDDEWKFYKCSICGNEAYWDTDYGQQLFDFCPHCGAKMDGKEVQE